MLSRYRNFPGLKDDGFERDGLKEGISFHDFSTIVTLIPLYLYLPYSP
jgi:hypothetical protein